MKKISNYLRYLVHTPPFLSWLHFKGIISRRNLCNDFDEKKPCIFVLSTGRVGSETLSALLALNSNIVSFHEPKPSLYKMSKVSYENNNPACANVIDAAFLSLRSDLFQYALKQSKGYIETSPQVTFLAPAIYRVMPNAKFIHLVRHPADVVRSGMRRKWYAGNSADTTRIVPGRSCAFTKNWSKLSSFTKNVWLWAETNQLQFAH